MTSHGNIRQTSGWDCILIMTYTFIFCSGVHVLTKSCSQNQLSVAIQNGLRCGRAAGGYGGGRAGRTGEEVVLF